MKKNSNESSLNEVTKSSESQTRDSKNSESSNCQIDTIDIDKAVSVELIIDKLPPFFHSLLNAYEVKDRKMMLISIITIVSSILPNVHGIYNQQKIYTNLFLYIIGKAGSGKGEVNRVRDLLFLIENKSTNSVEKEDLLKSLHEGKIGNKSIPRNPIILPGNSSAAGFTKLLSERNGNGLIFETEGDTLANTFKTDYGNYSDILRKAFHHETISQYRKTDNEYLNINQPKLSVLITSTINQLKRIISSAENGLFSRFMYWHTESNDEFIDVFSNVGDNRLELFSEASEKLFTLYHKLNESETIEIKYTDDQKNRFRTFFGKNKAQLTNLFHTDLEATANRMGIIMFRISMILTTLRKMDDKFDQIIFIDDVDFNMAQDLIECLIVNSFDTLELLPLKVKDINSENKLQLFRLLQVEFTTSDAKNLGKSLNLSDRTIDRFLKSNCFEKVSHGIYRKAD